MGTRNLTLNEITVIMITIADNVDADLDSEKMLASPIQITYYCLMYY